jgi:hypothetical protein
LSSAAEIDERVAWAKQRFAQLEREREDLLQQTREGRKQGKLSKGLVEKIKACTPKQLKRVIAFARENLKDYKRAPTLWDVKIYGKLLAQASYKNKLYSMEERKCGKPNCSKCPHGPYYIAHKRDGLYYPPKSLHFSELPRPVRAAFGPPRDKCLQKRSAERVRA